MKRRLSLLQLLGMGLILCGGALLLITQLRASRTLQKLEQTAARIEAALPEITPGIPGLYADPAMPVLEIDGVDHVGILDVPAFGRTLPIRSQWQQDIYNGPCRFWGSVNDSSLVIGGADQKGQFDFCGDIDLNAVVTVTDLTGAEFSYQVVRVDRSREAQAQWLCAEEYDLTLFVRNSTGLEYIAVRCQMAQ